MSLSTCQAEYIAMSDACRELIALDNSLKLILDVSLAPMTLHCDNQAAIASTKTGGGAKLKHMSVVSEHYVRECVNRKFVTINWVRSKEQLADIFTKSLSFALHDQLSVRLFNEIK